jgi:hypothetical protein
VPAAGLADVLVRDADPLVGVRVGAHALDQGAHLVLAGGALAECGAGVDQAGEQPVADVLELIDGEDPWAAARSGDSELDPRARERRSEQAAELGLQCRDLPAQLLTRVALVVLVKDGAEAGGRKRRHLGAALAREGFVELNWFEQLGH